MILRDNSIPQFVLNISKCVLSGVGFAQLYFVTYMLSDTWWLFGCTEMDCTDCGKNEVVRV